MSARRWNADRASMCPAAVALGRALSAGVRSLPECSLGARPSDVRSAPHSPLRWSGAAVARKNDMLRQFKKCTAAFAAITMFASSAASAAPRTADPLVALSVLGSAESHAAVCASGSGSPVCGGQSSAIPVAGSAAAGNQHDSGIRLRTDSPRKYVAAVDLAWRGPDRMVVDPPGRR